MCFCVKYVLLFPIDLFSFSSSKHHHIVLINKTLHIFYDNYLLSFDRSDYLIQYGEGYLE